MPLLTNISTPLQELVMGQETLNGDACDVGPLPLVCLYAMSAPDI